MGVWFWVIVALLVLAVADAAVLTFAVVVALPFFERRPPFNVRPATPSPDAEPVRFPALPSRKAGSAGLTLAGSLHRPTGTPRGLVVFCPEFGGSHWSAADYAAGLLDAGFAVLAFDFRSQGESDAVPGFMPSHWLTRPEVGDVQAALRYAATRDDLRELPVGVFGVSRGANAALAAAAREPHVRAVAAEGAFSTDAMLVYYAFRWAELYVPRLLLRLVPEWHLARSMRLVRRVSGFRHGVRYAVLEHVLPRLAGRPVLLIAGGRDSYVAPVIAERLRERIGPGCRPVWVVPGAKHNQGRATAGDEYDRRLAAFFASMTAENHAAARTLASAGR